MKINLIFWLFLTVAAFSCKTNKKNEALPVLTSLYQRDTGTPITLVFATYKTTMIASGKDDAMLRISVADSSDMEITDIILPFEISVKGDAVITDADGSSLEMVSDSDTLKVWKSQLANGVKKLKLKAGTTAGIVNVEVKTKDLQSASQEIHIISGDVKQMTPTSAQLKPSAEILPKMIGADISFLPQLEARGFKFSDKGVEKDAIEILKDHGLNYIRLRVFVNPENERGYSPNQGFCNLEHTLQMAKRVKEAGLNLLLDFHYSDTWADPQKQFKPKAWEGLNFGDLTSALKEYTQTVLLKMREQGTLPDMVQVGNEINHGIVWPDGHISNLDNLAELLKAGVEAVRNVDPQIKVMMHLALGGQNEEAVFWFDNMIARGLDFDIIGLSYYPRWHCTLDDLNYNMHDLIQRYQKDVNVVEYSAFKREVHQVVFSLPNNRGNGACIWEPLNTWSRVFDPQGNSLDVINVYDEISNEYLQKKG